ncbi:hypothetical protein NQ176_g1826 [Zarea fungicola]|uniref:Uncharacterized protein n=1 Tax=Zarea fungicola TaxID=93591 RepID=A0ACC1NS71_9HYPO|nr:hypothetical protein NQ176_g1826 [Lecanicillium fungicola]
MWYYGFTLLGLWFLSTIWVGVRSPLRKIPGPVVARISGLWLIYQDLQGRRSNVIHRLHLKYGPVVRIGPRQVSFSSAEAVRDIYGARNKLIKAPAYEAFGRQSSFTIRDRDAHRQRQKQIAHVFSPSAVAAVEPLVEEQVAQLVSQMLKHASQPIDIMEWFRIFALDVVGSVFLGKSFDGLSTGKAPRILHELDDVFPSLWAEWQFSTIRPFLLMLPIKSLTEFLKIGPAFYDHGRLAFDEYVATKGRSGDGRDLLGKLVRGNDKVQPLLDQEIVFEITNLIFAGTDTTSNTLSYLFYELAKLPAWQAKLQAELDENGIKSDPSYKDVSDLPVLDALIHETLRFHPAAPASLQRLTPQSEDLVIDGVLIPADTTVSCQSFTNQRDPELFPNPDQFNPGRWLNAPEVQLEAMYNRIFVWGKGQRSCLGKQLAMMELKLVTAALMRNFCVELGSDTTDSDMEMTDHFTLIAKGKKCILKMNIR